MNAHRTPLVAGLLLSIVLAGCAGGSVASPSPAAPTDPPPTRVPGGQEPSSPPPGGVIGGPGANPGNPGDDGFVVPRPGTINPRPVAIESLEVEVDGRAVTVIARWTSGVEPCYVLDSVAVKQDGNEFTIALTEGSGDADAVCIEIAKQKATRISLGELAPGDYVVAAQDETAKAVPFTVN